MPNNPAHPNSIKLNANPSLTLANTANNHGAENHWATAQIVR